MTKQAFAYLWEQGLVKAAQDVVNEVSEVYPQIIQKYHIVLELTDANKNKLYREYDQLRTRVRTLYFDTGENNENLMDTHKVSACIMGALLNVHLVTFDKKVGEMDSTVAYLNYAIAFLGGIYVQYLFLLSDYKRDGQDELYENLKKQATFYFPDTNHGHDSYIQGRIKTLAINDICGIDFDVLTYADMIFWIEKYNKDLLIKASSNEKISDLYSVDF